MVAACYLHLQHHCLISSYAASGSTWKSLVVQSSLLSEGAAQLLAIDTATTDKLRGVRCYNVSDLAYLQPDH